MAKIVQLTEKTRTWLRRLGIGVLGLILVLCALLVLGAHFPEINYAGGFGSLALSLWPAWFILVPAFSAAMLWQFSNGRLRTVLTVLALLTALGASLVLARLVTVARANEVSLTVKNAFGFSDSLETATPDEVVVYTRDQGEDLTLRIFRPKGSTPAGGWPVLLHIHGGGWVSGSNEEQSADLRWFANQGWVTISANYSLSSEQHHLWNRVHDQLGCAMGWIGANIAARGGDPARLAVRGGSAGGNLALNVAYKANAGTLRSTCGGKIPKVRSVMPIYPGVDLAAINANTYPITGPDVQSMVQRYTGGTPRQYPDRYAAVASASHITPFAPPTLIFISENDHLVPLASMRKFADQVRRAGIPLRVVSQPHAEHGFEITGIGNVLVREVSLQFMRKYDSKLGASRP